MSIVETDQALPPSDAPDSDYAPCPVCGRPGMRDFFSLPRLPVHVGVLYQSADEARRALCGSVTLAHCPGCGFVRNRCFEPEKLVFEPGYEVQLVHSAMFRAFLEQLADRLVAAYDLRGKDVLDIGCGAGHFLRLLCERGGNSGVGIDPTLRQEGELSLAAGRMRLIRSLFGPRFAESEFDFASCQSVLEDIPNPVAFVRQIGRTLIARRGVAYLEIFNAFRAFQAGEIWSICYEQCNYFSADSFVETVRRAGFDILASGGCYGTDQYIYVEAQAAAAKPSRPSAANGECDTPEVIAGFAKLHSTRARIWGERIKRFRANRQQVVLWGSGGKGICFLNTLGDGDVFAAVVDINPDRQQQYVPGTGQLVVPPAWLRDNPPDVVVLTNPLYEAEIRQTVAELGVQCQFMTI